METIKYEEALRQLDEIVQKMERNEYGIDELTTQLKKAKELIQLCKNQLTKTDEDIKKILEDDK
ncbi:MAG: exodeoxyribonuclease VII small subunit [Prevotella sp.]|jgi:exodeoxyribonuclease VII small subunit|nr:exodeoxyribonuclease VII small subunit [Prevotella sp.]MBQ8456113.1 exodeoxyribonuclease VII small subunit [Prevotella sp.]